MTLRDLNYQKIPRPDLDREVVNVAAMIVLEADLVILTSTVECHVKLQIIPFMMISVNPEGIMSPGIIKTVVDTGLEIVGVKILEAVVEVEGKDFFKILSMLKSKHAANNWNPTFLLMLKITERSFAECMTTVLATLQCRR